MEVRLRENSPEIKLTVTTDETVPSAIGKGEVCPRTISWVKYFVMVGRELGPLTGYDLRRS
jgi:hypothetical protein